MEAHARVYKDNKLELELEKIMHNTLGKSMNIGNGGWNQYPCAN